MLAEYALREHGIEILLNLKEDLPPVEGDSIQIEQVTLNLLTNAIDALQAQATTTANPPETGATAELACLKVVDNGPGIPDTMLSKLFTLFSTTKPHGMGLGLTICQSIIESHQGHISGRNQPEGGGSFRITLPLQNAQPSSAALCERNLCLMTPTPNFDPIVYVVDDDPAVLDSVSLLIRSAGLKVMAFPSALEFLAAFIPNQIACLVLDIRMPGTTGLELQAELEGAGVAPCPSSSSPATATWRSAPAPSRPAPATFSPSRSTANC